VLSDGQVITLFLPNIQILVASFKHWLGNKQYVYNILAFKVNNGYDYTQDSCFLGQQTKEKMFLFKIFVHGDGSGSDLMQWMQPSGNLQMA